MGLRSALLCSDFISPAFQTLFLLVSALVLDEIVSIPPKCKPIVTASKHNEQDNPPLKTKLSFLHRQTLAFFFLLNNKYRVNRTYSLDHTHPSSLIAQCLSKNPHRIKQSSKISDK